MFTIVENYYEGYLLDDCRCMFELSDIEKRCLEVGVYFVQSKQSIRSTARNMGMSKSQVHRDLHNLKGISYELYKCVVRKLAQNLEDKDAFKRFR